MKKQPQQKQALITCKDCKHAGKVENFMVPCNNKECNPNGHYKGTYPRYCDFFSITS